MKRFGRRAVQLTLFVVAVALLAAGFGTGSFLLLALGIGCVVAVVLVGRRT